MSESNITVEPVATVPTETFRAIQESFHRLTTLRNEQQATTAVFLRSCVSQLKSPNAILRRQAIAVMEDYAAYLEGGK